MSTPAPYGQVPDAPGPSVPPPPAPPTFPQAPAQRPAQPQQPAQAQQHAQAHQQAQQQAYQQHAGQPGSFGPPQHAPQQHPYPGQVAPDQGGGRARSRRTGTIVVTALVTSALSVTVTLLATGALTPPPLFDQEALESGVSTVLTDDFALTDVADVACPAEVVAQSGEQFECTFSSGGEDLSVPVEVLNDDGQYRVGGPLSEDEAGEG